MSYTKPIFYLSLMLIILASACQERDNYRQVPDQVRGYVPVYVDSTEYISGIKSVHPRSIGTVGRTYLYRNYMFIVEEESGIHVYDIADTAQPPVPVCYIITPRTNSLFIKDDILYIQNAIGLIYIDISNLPDISVLGVVTQPTAVRDVFSGIPGTGFDFATGGRDRGTSKIFIECPDPSKGTIIQWERKLLTEPKCYIIK